MGAIIKGGRKLFKKKKPSQGGSAVQQPMRDAKSKNQRYQRFGDGEDKEVPIPQKKFRETEGTRRDPVGKGSVDAARDVGTRGEKVAQGSKSGANFLTDQSAVGGGRKRAKTKVQLEKLEREGNLTKAQKTRLANMRKADKEAVDRQAGKNVKSRLAKSKAQKKVAADKKAEEDLTHFYQTGEIRKGFKPTAQQEKQAIKNLKARGMSKQAREIEARRELGAKAFAKQKNKEGKRGGGPKEFKSRPEERKQGGSVMKKVTKKANGGRMSRVALSPAEEARAGVLSEAARRRAMPRGTPIAFRPGGGMIDKGKIMHGYKKGGQV
jgi:hypothetical protein